MLTPVFEVQQDSDFLTVIIKAPYSQVTDAEISIDGCEFKFHSKPYFLRLNFPHELVEDGREEAKYDSDSGYFTVRVSKATSGQEFEGLDMLTKLLEPRGGARAQGAGIEVIGGDDPAVEDVDDFDWQVEQTLADDVTLGTETYGFAGLRSGVFSSLKDELQGIIDLSDPDTTPAHCRTQMRQGDEASKFSDDHYLADYFDDESSIKTALDFQPLFVSQYEAVQNDSDLTEVVVYTDEEKEQLKNLPNKEYLLSTKQKREALLSLADLMFAYAYNHRSTLGENTVESGWTIAKLSSTLSWFQVFSSLNEVAVACYRRSLCYPLFRSWALTVQVWQDTVQLFQLGRKRVLKCLLEIHRMFREGDHRYILNDLYITDYCVWLQCLSEKQFGVLADKLSQVTVSKKDLKLDVEVLERAAFLVLQEDNETESVSESLAALDLATDPLRTLKNPQFDAPESYVMYKHPDPDAGSEQEELELASSTDSSDSSDTDSGGSQGEPEPTTAQERLNMSTIVEEKSEESSNVDEGLS